jgi:hypothetical protein
MDREGEHAVEALDAGRPPLGPGLQDHLGVAGRGEAVAGLGQLLAQLLVVVDAAVEGDRQAQRGVDEGLRGGFGQVDDLQPAVAEADRPRSTTPAPSGPRGAIASAIFSIRAAEAARPENDLSANAAHAGPFTSVAIAFDGELLEQ